MDPNRSHRPSQPNPLEVELRLLLARCREAEAQAAILEAKAAAATFGAQLDVAERVQLLALEVQTRRTTLRMGVITTFYVMVVLVLGAVFHPWLIPAGLGAAGLAYLGRRWRPREREPGGGAEPPA